MNDIYIKKIDEINKQIIFYFNQLESNLLLFNEFKNRLKKINVYNEVKAISSSIYFGMDMFFDDFEEDLYRGNVIDISISLYMLKDNLRIRSTCTSIYSEREFFDIEFENSNGIYMLSERNEQLLYSFLAKEEIPQGLIKIIEEYLNSTQS